MAENAALKKSTAVDMTVGSIPKHLLFFAVPLMLGNIFQVMYNTIDAWVVGNFVGKEALAAVGSLGSVTNMAVFFFNGISIGAGVVISKSYGARDKKTLHIAVETTIALTFILSILFSVCLYFAVPYMLKFMKTPDDVWNYSAIYLKIYFLGLPGLLFYNLGSAILRAVGDTKRPLMFLIFTSITNMILDLVFVLCFGMEVKGVALATLIAQVCSAILVMRLLITTDDIYKFVVKDLQIDPQILKEILAIGLPTGVQSMLTAFSNVFVQGYINAFGSDVMAGWSCWMKLNQIIFLPIQSMAQSVTTFVGQNIGAKNTERARKGALSGMTISLIVSFASCSLLFIAAGPASALFNNDAAVISFATLFIRCDVYFLLFNTINHVTAGALRGEGDSRGPMVCMLSSFVVLRQIYLYIASGLSDSIFVVAFAFPLGWVSCCILELSYYFYKIKKNKAYTAQ